MTGQQPDAGAPPAIRRLAVAAHALLIWERLWAALWSTVGLCGAFLTLAFSGLLPGLPGWLHAGVLVAALLGGAAALAIGVRGFRWPCAAEARRRLERDNQLPHRPLQALADRPTGADALAAEVWRLHQQQAASQSAGRVRLHPPRSGLAACDRFGLRFVLGAALLASVVTSWGEGAARLAAALEPHPFGAPVPAVLDVWLTPPGYTGLPPVLLRRNGAPPAEALTVPAGSAVLARVSGGSGLPVLTVNGRELRFAAIDEDGHFELRAAVRAGSELAVRQDGRTLGRWPVQVRPEMPPRAAFTAPPGQTGRGALSLGYRAEDDYGLVSVSLTVRPETPMAIGGDALDLPLPAAGADHRRVEGAAVRDLTASPWAGLPVRLHLQATGAAGLTGQSEDLALVLPERGFAQPVARHLVAVRKRLARDGEDARFDAARELGALSVRPEDFDNDASVFLALRVAVAQLGHDQEPEALAEIGDLLWQTALRLEDGTLSLARRDLDAAEQALRQALDGNASDEDIRKRIDELEAALAHYLESLENQQAEAPPPGTMEHTDLGAMLQPLRDMTDTGARDNARRMLSDLSELLENLRAADGPPSPAQAHMQEMARQLQAVTEGESQLLDRTFHALRDRDPEASPEPKPDSGDAARQAELRRQLGELLTGLGEAGAIPKPLGEAERAMATAEKALAAGDGETALAAEGEAVEKLRQGQKEIGRAMAVRMVGAGARDPLGRRRPGYGDGAGVRLPEQREVQRAREILDELRRRAGERERPRQELDYIERLLHQF